MPTTNGHSHKVLLQVEAAHWLTLLRQLTRAELSAMVALSALAGYLFTGRGWQLSGLLCLLGIWLLAAGGSALNQWQEQDLDARMQRTRFRPLPTGQLSTKAALAISACCLFSGLLLLSLLPNGAAALLLGLLAVIWYNGIYTPLKRRTPFAALPGAVCGSLPPLIGWSAAGGSLLAPEILILSGTLFLWQIPHTWLLLCHYRSDLQNSGLPNLFERLSTEQLLRINNCWLAALGLCYLLFPLFGLIANPTLSTTFLAGLTLLAFAVIKLRRQASPANSSIGLFHLTNLSMALLLFSLILDNLIS
ncbi:MAG TPA: UbiA family prenyltransferase [Malonomonas sp.]